MLHVLFIGSLMSKNTTLQPNTHITPAYTHTQLHTTTTGSAHSKTELRYKLLHPQVLVQLFSFGHSHHVIVRSLAHVTATEQLEGLIREIRRPCHPVILVVPELLVNRHDRVVPFLTHFAATEQLEHLAQDRGQGTRSWRLTRTSRDKRQFS